MLSLTNVATCLYANVEITGSGVYQYTETITSVETGEILIENAEEGTSHFVASIYLHPNSGNWYGYVMHMSPLQQTQKNASIMTHTP